MLDRLPKYDVSLHITHNQHKSYYESAADYLRSHRAGDGFDPDEWLSRADFEEAIAQGSIWEIQWYPNTPVGFCIAYGSTLENALQAANLIESKELK